MKGKMLVLATVSLFAAVGCSRKDGVKEYEAGQAAFVVGDFIKADKMFSKCVQYAAENADAWLYLARVKLALAELGEARQAIGQAQRLAGGDCDVQLMSAQIAWHSRDYATASGIYRRLAEDSAVDPDIRAHAYSGLGVVEMSCNNHHLARLAFFRAIRIDRRNAAAWYHLGVLYRESFGYHEAALDQFETYVRLAEVADVRVQDVQRNVIPALKDVLQQAAATRPGVSKRDSAVAASALARAEAAWKKNSFKLAQGEYEKALAADPLSYKAALGLAKAGQKADASKKGQERSFMAYKTACELNPSALSTFLTTGALATKLGYYSQAVEIYSRAVAASPTSKVALDGMIAALRKVGNKNSIAKAYQLYRDMLPKK